MVQLVKGPRGDMHLIYLPKHVTGWSIDSCGLEHRLFFTHIYLITALRSCTVSCRSFPPCGGFCISLESLPSSRFQLLVLSGAP
jgi:hypothetical protein